MDQDGFVLLGKGVKVSQLSSDHHHDQPSGRLRRPSRTFLPPRVPFTDPIELIDHLHIVASSVASSVKMTLIPR